MLTGFRPPTAARRQTSVSGSMMTRNVCQNNLLVSGDVSETKPCKSNKRNNCFRCPSQQPADAEPAARLMKWLLILRPCKDLAPPYKPGGERVSGGTSRLGWLWNREGGNVVTALQRQSKRVQTAAEQREAGGGERKQVWDLQVGCGNHITNNNPHQTHCNCSFHS